MSWVYFPDPPDPPRVVHLVSFNSLDEIVSRPQSWTSAFRPVLPGPRVGTPQGLTYRDGILYICDTFVGCVHVWNLLTAESRTLSGLGKPVSVAVDDAGRIFVADTTRNEIVVFDSATATTRPQRLAVEGRPVSLAIDGERLHVADAAGHRIITYATATLEVVEGGGIGEAQPPLAFPAGLDVGPDGELYVADMMNGRVQVFGPAGVAPRAIGRPGDRYGCLGQPKAVACSADGVVFIADALFSCIHLFRSDGGLLLVIGGAGDEPGDTPMPNGLAVAASLPTSLAHLVPPDFTASSFLWASNTTGRKRISLFALGHGTTAEADAGE